MARIALTGGPGGPAGRPGPGAPGQEAAPSGYIGASTSLREMNRNPNRFSLQGPPGRLHAAPAGAFLWFAPDSGGLRHRLHTVAAPRLSPGAPGLTRARRRAGIECTWRGF